MATALDYLARLRGGPDDGAVVRVAPLPGGAPPDFFHAGPDDAGVYVLAGLPHADGTMPYWFMSSLPGTADPLPVEASTWTLVSLSGRGDSLKVWHQHGEGASPVPLRSQAVGTAHIPSLVGRAFSCPVCKDTMVISLPDA